ncbi:VOC family protein [Streptomyces sp. MAR4 CNY-716]
MPARFKDLALDARDHQALADWWCTAIGYARREDPEGQRPAEWPVPIHDPAGRGPLIWINPVPEEKAGKNRMHLDVWGVPAEFEALGARLLRRRDDEIDWHVMADPEGNEFCVFEEKR